MAARISSPDSSSSTDDLPELEPLPMGDADCDHHVYMTRATPETHDVAASSMTSSMTDDSSPIAASPPTCQNNLFPSILFTQRPSSPAKDDYILDSGATTSVVDLRSVMHDFVPEPTQVKGVGGFTSSTGRGTLRISLTADDGRPIDLVFRGTLCVPGAPRLLSLTRIVDGGAVFTVPSPDRALLSIGMAIISAVRVNGLYLLRATTIPPPRDTAQIDDTLHAGHTVFPAQAHGYSAHKPFDGTMDELHSTMGHASAAVMNRQLRDGLLDWISPRLQRDLRSTTRFQCTSCSQGKITRRSIAKSHGVSEQLRFHSDTFGPCTQAYASQCKYAIIYVHQSSGFCSCTGCRPRPARVH